MIEPTQHYQSVKKAALLWSCGALFSYLPGLDFNGAPGFLGIHFHTAPNIMLVRLILGLPASYYSIIFGIEFLRFRQSNSEIRSFPKQLDEAYRGYLSQLQGVVFNLESLPVHWERAVNEMKVSLSGIGDGPLPPPEQNPYLRSEIEERLKRLEVLKSSWDDIIRAIQLDLPEWSRRARKLSFRQFSMTWLQYHVLDLGIGLGAYGLFITLILRDVVIWAYRVH